MDRSEIFIKCEIILAGNNLSCSLLSYTDNRGQEVVDHCLTHSFSSETAQENYLVE